VIISRAPLRVSFLGGITDYPEYFNQENRFGCVIGATINKWVNVIVLPQPEFESVKFRFTYRITEAVDNHQDIVHPVVRSVLGMKRWKTPLNIATMAQLPGRSGLGSSSSFTVAMLAALRQIESPTQISDSDRDIFAREAVRIEREIIGEVGGFQDQYHAAIGGFRLYKFEKDRVLHSLIGTEHLREYFSKSLVLIATGGGRDSKFYAGITQNRIRESTRIKLLDSLAALTLHVSMELETAEANPVSLKLLGDAMNEAWKIKIDLSGHESTVIDELIDYGLSKGAMGAKLCGAGGSGFAAFLVDPRKKSDFIRNFPIESVIDVEMTPTGVHSEELFRN